MKKLITLLFVLLTLNQTASLGFAISPKTQFPSEKQTALSLLEDLTNAASLDFKQEKEVTPDETKNKPRKRTIYKNNYRNMFYYYGMLYGSSTGSISSVGNSYSTVYNNYRARSAYGIPVNKVNKSANSKPIKRFDLFFHQKGNNNFATSKETLKKDQFIPGEAMTVLDEMHKEFENMFLKETPNKMIAKLSIFKNALDLINKSIASKQKSRVIAAYEQNSGSAKRNDTIFIIRAFLTTVIAKMENKLTVPFNHNIQNAVFASA